MTLGKLQRCAATPILRAFCKELEMVVCLVVMVCVGVCVCVCV